MMTFFKTTIPSPVGDLILIASDAGLRALKWKKVKAGRVMLPSTTNGKHPILEQTVHELSEYFAGKRKRFTVKLDPVGTAFQLKAWQALREIPYGEIRSYLQQATAIGNAKAMRAVGGANGRNPISIIVPCHRVIGKNGSLVGFGGGIATKEYLLRHEGALI